MMARCETCPHWKREPTVLDEFDYYPSSGSGPVAEVEKGEGLGRRNRDPLGDWGECAMAEGSASNPVRTEALVFARDMSSYHAHLSTHRTFGCVQHPHNQE